MSMRELVYGAEADGYRAEGSVSTAQALQEYQHALRLDPADNEALRGIARLQRR